MYFLSLIWDIFLFWNLPNVHSFATRKPCYYLLILDRAQDVPIKNKNGFLDGLLVRGSGGAWLIQNCPCYKSKP